MRIFCPSRSVLLRRKGVADNTGIGNVNLAKAAQPPSSVAFSARGRELALTSRTRAVASRVIAILRIMSALVPLLLALLGFAIAGPALVVAFVTAHVWLAATILLRLGNGDYVKAVLWGCMLAAVVHLDVSWLL